MRLVASALLALSIGCASASVPPAQHATAPDPAWRDRVAKVTKALTQDSLHPGDAAAIEAAAWRALGEAPGAEPLADHVGTRVADGSLAPEDAWRVVGAMVGTVDDAHVLLLSPVTMKAFEAAVGGGAFTAPGLVVHWAGDELLVSEVLAGGPAGDAGVQVGDVITAIDGAPPARAWSVRAMTFVAPGASTELAIQRDGAARTIAFEARPYLHPVSTHRVVGDTGVLRPYFFAAGEQPERNTVEQARAALADFDRAKVTGVVLDLRGNQGGVKPARYASLFTDADPLLVSRARGEAPEAWPNERILWPTRRPIAVLIDQQTISAAEMVALALRTHAGARLFGQPTGRALNVPDIVDLGDGHALYLPLVPVFPPGAPDVPAPERVDPDELVADRTQGDLRAGRDPQLDAAIRWLAIQPR